MTDYISEGELDLDKLVSAYKSSEIGACFFLKNVLDATSYRGDGNYRKRKFAWILSDALEEISKCEMVDTVSFVSKVLLDFPRYLNVDKYDIGKFHESCIAWIKEHPSDATKAILKDFTSMKNLIYQDGFGLVYTEYGEYVVEGTSYDAIVEAIAVAAEFGIEKVDEIINWFLGYPYSNMGYDHGPQAGMVAKAIKIRYPEKKAIDILVSRATWSDRHYYRGICEGVFEVLETMDRQSVINRIHEVMFDLGENAYRELLERLGAEDEIRSFDEDEDYY